MGALGPFQSNPLRVRRIFCFFFVFVCFLFYLVLKVHPYSAQVVIFSGNTGKQKISVLYSVPAATKFASCCTKVLLL